MSYVSIWRPVNDRIVQASRESENEVIGLLLGRLENDTIVIENSVTGEFTAGPNRVTLPSITIAKIADDIVRGRVKGKIVGWYHSHTETGLFFSDIDIQTQKTLQQFSPFITAMVVDSQTGDVAFYRIDPQTGAPIRTHEEKVRVYAEPSEAIPLEARAKPRVRPTPAIEVRARLQEERVPLGRLVIVIVIVALAASAILVGALLYRGGPAVSGVTITHTPVTSATVGTSLNIKTNVTGQVRSVTLYYAPVGAPDFTQVEMNSLAAGQYEYLIPGDKVVSNIAYYVRATDSGGNSVSTPKYVIAVADFIFVTTHITLTVYRTKSIATMLNLAGINGFDREVALGLAGAPEKLNITFAPNPANMGAIQLTASAAADTTTGTFPLAVMATYTPAEGTPITRQAIVLITVADFDVQVSPISRQVSKGTAASYTLTLTVGRGFTDTVTFNVTGLPQGTTYQVVTAGNTIAPGSSGTVILTLQISTTQLTRAGTYNLTVMVAGGGIIHTQTVQLTVR